MSQNREACGLPPTDLQRNRCRGYQFDQGMDCSELPERRRPHLIPVRILTACAKGHVQDFPFLEWVHQDTPVTNNCTKQGGKKIL